MLAEMTTCVRFYICLYNTFEL